MPTKEEDFLHDILMITSLNGGLTIHQNGYAQMKDSVSSSHLLATRLNAASDISRPITLRVSEVQRITGLGRTKIYALITNGELSIVKIGRATLIPLSSLEALLERGQQHRS